MRAIKNLADAEIVLRELLDWKHLHESKDWDFHSLRIKNASPGVDPFDYATVSQLPKLDIPEVVDKDAYTIVWESQANIVAGQLFPSFVVGLGRVGIPNEVWLKARTSPTTGPLTINISVNGFTLLDTNLSLGIGQAGPIFSSRFVNLAPKLALHSDIFPTISAADSSAAIISIGLVVRISQI